MFSSFQVVIGDILPYTQATAIGGQTVFNTNWTANVATDIVVFQTPNGNPPNDVTQMLATNLYTIAFIGSQQQVQVTLVNPASAGDIITITRQTPAARENLYNNTNFTPSMLNNDFGILTLVDQQAQLVNQLIGPRYNYSAVIVDVTDNILPILGPNQVWVKNPTNTAIIASTISGGIPPGGGGVNPGLQNQIAWYAANGNVVSGFGPANNSVVVTSNTGVPSLSQTLPLAVQNNISSLTGLTGYLQAPLGFKDNAGNKLLDFAYAANSVNYFLLSNAATGTAPSLNATGADASVPFIFSNKNAFFNFIDSTNTLPANIRLYNAAGTFYTGLKAQSAQATSVDFILPPVDGSANFIMKTNGASQLSLTDGSQIAGTTTNTNASSGNIGEIFSAVVLASAPVTLTTATNTDLAHIVLPAGDFDYWGNVGVSNNSIQLVSCGGWINTVSATQPDGSMISGLAVNGSTPFQTFNTPVPGGRSISNAPVTLYLSAVSAFPGGGTTIAFGQIFARRRR